MVQSSTAMIASQIDWKCPTWLLVVVILVAADPAAMSAAPDGDAIVKRASPVVVTFSDRSSRWDPNTVFVGRLGRDIVVVRTRALMLDTDGAAGEVRACDRTSQVGTALSDHRGRPTDANSVPYFVLPGCGGAADEVRCKRNPPYKQLGLGLGNVAAVVVGGRVAYAIAADMGPEKKFGEGSIELHRQLGHETIGLDSSNPRCARDESLDATTTFVIFTDVSGTWLSKERIAELGEAKWRKLIADRGAGH
jgi:hypothetical protein